MLIPNTVSLNTLEAYKLPQPIYLRGTLCSDDFSWDANRMKSLRYLCLDIISNNWEQNPLCDELIIPADKAFLFEILSTDLSLEQTVKIIQDDIYWKRRYLARWPYTPIPDREVVERGAGFDDESQQEEEEETEQEDVLSTVSIESESSNITRYYRNSQCYVMKKYAQVNGNEDDDFVLPPLKTWKQCFFERFAEEELERMLPDMFNEDYIKDLCDLCGDLIVSLHLNSLKTSKEGEPVHHISLYYLLHNLPNLLELSVCFNEKNLGDNFSWHTTKVSENDCTFLGKGIAYSSVEIFRVIRSDIDCEKLKLLIQPLCAHKTLRALDLSYCKISDTGALALGAMLKQTPLIQTLILTNNKIGAKGAQGLGYYLCLPESRLVELNLKLNPLGPEGGKFIATALARGALTLRMLSLSACGLTTENLYIGKALSLNSTLQKFDLSNNHLGEDTGHIFLDGLERNETLLYLDLRMTDISAETIEDIQMIVTENLKRTRGILKSTVYAEEIM